MSIILYAILTGVLLSLAQVPALGFLVWFGLVPLLYGFFKLTKQGSRRSLFAILGFVAGLGYFSVVLFWLWSVYPLDSLGFSNMTSFLLIFFLWALATISMALCWAGLGYGFSFAKRWLNTKARKLTFILLVFPALFTLAEYARAYSLELTWWGQGSVIGPHFPFGSLAYSLTNVPIILNLASYIGIYGITFLIAFTNGLIFLLLFGDSHARKRRRLACVVLICGLALLPFIKLGDSHKDNRTNDINFALIQTEIATKADYAPEERLKSLEGQLIALATIAKEHPETDMIIFPEGSNFLQNALKLLNTPEVEHYFNSLFSHPALIVDNGDVRDAEGQRYSRTLFFDTDEGAIGSYDKRVLTPAGEFMPYILQGLIRLSLGKAISNNIQARIFHPGPAERPDIHWGGINISSFVCSDVLSPGYIRKHVTPSQLLIGQMSLGIFRGNTQMAHYTREAARFRATENHIPVVIASNMAPSYAIDEHGTVVQETHTTKSQILTGSIALGEDGSWYNRLGDWPILLLVFTVVLAYLFA